MMYSMLSKLMYDHGARKSHVTFDKHEKQVMAFLFEYFSLNSDTSRSMLEAINHANNQIFCVNVVHIISQMSDIICNACGGLLPLLASATSASVIVRFSYDRLCSIKTK
jgi:hypothetical protein